MTKVLGFSEHETAAPAPFLFCLLRAISNVEVKSIKKRNLVLVRVTSLQLARCQLGVGKKQKAPSRWTHARRRQFNTLPTASEQKRLSHGYCTDGGIDANRRQKKSKKSDASTLSHATRRGRNGTRV